MPTLKKIRAKQARLYRDLGASWSKCQSLEKTSIFILVKLKANILKTFYIRLMFSYEVANLY